jgi:hypothetical protein
VPDPKEPSTKFGSLQPSIADANIAAIEAAIPVPAAGHPSGEQTAAVPAFPAGPEPARIYGYVTFVDPSTGAEHIPHGQDNPLMTIGYPDAVTIRFVNPAGQLWPVVLGGAGTGFYEVRRLPDGHVDYTPANNGGIAWYYDIQMNPDQSEGAPRVGAPAGVVTNYLRTEVVSYNPDQWRFLDVVGVGDYITSSQTLAFTRRASPFADLPDTE